MAKKIKIRPLGSRVLVQAVKQKESGGIVLPDDVESGKDHITAEVVSLGTDDEKIKVKKGEHVLLDAFSGKKIEIDGEEFLIVKSIDILAIVEQ
ncbi:co-chaperone GroES [Candidatus Acetothermia bacterium]|nr:co-chaperone GroES [Candidatus Acetothermia bacterium]MBI3642852.1 co-chaperone GroES [Candidatus Acetothermia bacterium]